MDTNTYLKVFKYIRNVLFFSVWVGYWLQKIQMVNITWHSYITSRYIWRPDVVIQSRLKGLLNLITKQYMILRHRMITIDCIVIITSLVCNIPSILLENSTLIGKVPWPCILAFLGYMVFRICKLDSIHKTNKEIFLHCQSFRKYTYLDYFQIILDIRAVYFTVFWKDAEY